MFCVKLSGGLGNQMFQYAFARSLCLNHNVPFVLDYSFFENIEHKVKHTKRNYELDVFDINVKKLSKKNQQFFKNSLITKCNVVLNKTFNIPLIFKSKVINEERFNSENIKNPNHLFYNGYWQSEKYFKSIEKTIRSDFEFKIELSNKNQIIKNKIIENNSIGIHVRRGDYVTNLDTFNTHGVCSLHYYNDAIKEIKKKIKNPIFFIFSDDTNWVKKNFSELKNCNYIDWNTGDNSYVDMQLMSKCKHNIIANSSFSWWSAWLNNNKNKIVIAPIIWFSNKKYNSTALEIIPKEWLRI